MAFLLPGALFCICQGVAEGKMALVRILKSPEAQSHVYGRSDSICRHDRWSGPPHS